MTKDRSKLFLLAALSFLPQSAWAYPKGLHLSVTGIALNSSTRQGGQGPAGTSILTHSDLLLSTRHLGLGVFLQADAQGSSQRDLGYGPKVELHFGAFYAELGWAAQVKRSYTDRSIAQDTGTGWIVGAGVRLALSAKSAAASKGWFFQASYRYRLQHITKQDGVPIGETITQYDGYPTLGFGYDF